MLARNCERTGNMPRTDNLLIDLDILRKEEIAQRRKVRIQQVRLQSKDIANKVLRDIQIEKNRQFQLNKAKEEDVFKKWRERKISEVSLLYKENINRIGEAYRNAEKEPDPEKEIEERSLKLTAIAKDRGKKAMDLLRRERENAKIHKESSAARREKVRKVENMRSSLISSLPNSETYRNINEEPTDLEEDSYGRSIASNNEDSMEMFVEEVVPPKSNPKIPNLRLGSARIPSEKISVQTSCKSTQSHKHPVAFTVDLYDRSNPCTFTKRLPDTVRVERMSSDAWRNAAEAAAEEEKRELERKEKKERELKATDERGKKALAKEMIRRDFDQLMLRLDGLARKERLARGLVEPYLPLDMYMSESRCAAKAEKRQRNLDTVFEGILYSNGVEETQKVPETQSPLSIEKATVPEGWLPILSETPPEILNVGLQSNDTSNLSIENATDEENPSDGNISFKEASINLPSSALSKEKIPGDSRRAALHKEDFIKDSNPPMTLPSRGSTSSRSEDVQDSVQEDTQVPISSGTTLPREVVKVPDIVKIADKDAQYSSDEKQECIPRREACIQTEDLTYKNESSSGMEKDTIVPRGELDSSSQDSSVKIEEVKVVLRFNDSSLPSTEESGNSTAALKMEKKKVVVWKKHCKMASDEKLKTVINLESPEASVRESDKEQETRKSLPVGNGKKEKRRKRSKEDVIQTEKSMHVSALKSANPICPSLEDIASERRAKALLKEVRAQRKEIERLRAGLSAPKTEPPPLGCYVRKLLSMTRESVEALSVSDVSTPSIHFDSPKKVWSPVEEETREKFQVKKVDKATSPGPGSALLVDETVSLETSSTKLTSSSKGSSSDTLPVSSPSITSQCDSVQDSSHDLVQTAVSPVEHLKPFSPTHLPPLTPPPSPEYDQLADQHSRRIDDLATQLMIVREYRKRILSDDRSTENEKSSSSSISIISKVSGKSSSSGHSLKRNEDLPLNASEIGRDLDFPDLSIPEKESSEDISLPDDLFLDLEKPSRLSQEVLSLRRKPSTKSGPPPTPLKGLKWSDFDFQIPHELSTITEVDSKLISALSIPESRKEKGLQTSTRGANEILPAEAVTKTASTDHPEEIPVKPLMETSDSCRTPKEKVNRSETPLLQSSSPHDKSLELIPESELRTSEPASEEKSLDSASNSPKYSDSQVPETLDEVFRILGISPTIFKRPDSPLDIVVKESSTEKHPSPSLHSDSKTNSLEKNIVMPEDDVEQVSELGKEACHSLESFGRSPFGASSHQLRHSTPLPSSSETTSSSDSKQTSGFPFLGESAPSSICSNGTPQGGNWRNIDDDDDSATPKGG